MRTRLDHQANPIHSPLTSPGVYLRHSDDYEILTLEFVSNGVVTSVEVRDALHQASALDAVRKTNDHVLACTHGKYRGVHYKGPQEYQVLDGKSCVGTYRSATKAAIAHAQHQHKKKERAAVARDECDAAAARAKLARTTAERILYHREMVAHYGEKVARYEGAATSRTSVAKRAKTTDGDGGDDGGDDDGDDDDDVEITGERTRAQRDDEGRKNAILL